MAKFGTKEDLLTTIQEHFERMNAGRLGLDELNELVELTGALHERTVILRYKAIEARVFEHSDDPVSEARHEVEDTEAKNEAISPELPNQKEEKEEKTPEAKPEAQDETPTIDFSLFGQDEEESEPFSFEAPETPSSEPQRAPEPEVKPEVKTSTQGESAGSPAPQQAENKPETTEAPKPEPKTEVPPVSGSFADRLAQEDNSLAKRLKLSKLDTLVGSFGMNERLQYINELFDGSGEAFSDAIKKLDGQQNLEAARRIAFAYSDEFSWDIDSETVAEFMQKLDRRYA